jgi:hypothetical protein
MPPSASRGGGSTGGGQSGAVPVIQARPVRDCSMPQWLVPLNARLDMLALRLHRLNKLDTAQYIKAAPSQCAQELFVYRLGVLEGLIGQMEK